MKFFLSMCIGLIILTTIVFFYQHSESPITSSSLIIKLGEDLSKKHDMLLSAYGRKFDDGITVVSLSFKKYDPGPTIEQTRKLIVNVLNEAVSLVNENEEMKPYLKTFPSTAENFDINIVYYDKNGREVKPPHIVAVTIWEGDITY